MGQVLHGSATTTEAVRRAIQHSQESLRALAKRYSINPKTVAKWKNRTAVGDLPTGPKAAKSTILTIEEEAIYAADADPWLAASARYRYQHRKYEVLISLLPTKHFKRALDLGCGLGLLSRRLPRGRGGWNRCCSLGSDQRSRPSCGSAQPAVRGTRSARPAERLRRQFRSRSGRRRALLLVAARRGVAEGCGHAHRETFGAGWYLHVGQSLFFPARFGITPVAAHPRRLYLVAWFHLSVGTPAPVFSYDTVAMRRRDDRDRLTGGAACVTQRFLLVPTAFAGCNLLDLCRPPAPTASSLPQGGAYPNSSMARALALS